MHLYRRWDISRFGIRQRHGMLPLGKLRFLYRRFQDKAWRAGARLLPRPGINLNDLCSWYVCIGNTFHLLNSLHCLLPGWKVSNFLIFVCHRSLEMLIKCSAGRIGLKLGCKFALLVTSKIPCYRFYIWTRKFLYARWHALASFPSVETFYHSNRRSTLTLHV